MRQQKNDLRDRAIQALRDQGFTQAEIGEVLDLSRSTVIRCLNPEAKEAHANATRRSRQDKQPFTPLF